jgi:hypothetical protein
MIKSFQYKRTIRKLRKKQLKISKELEQVSSNVNTPENFANASLICQEEDKMTKWIENLQTEHLCNTCQDLLIPIPDRKDKNLYYQFNFDDDQGERYILTSIGFHHVKKLIREEYKERREVFGYWTTLIIGIIGAFIGLISIIK